MLDLVVAFSLSFCCDFVLLFYIIPSFLRFRFIDLHTFVVDLGMMYPFLDGLSAPTSPRHFTAEV